MKHFILAQWASVFNSCSNWNRLRISYSRLVVLSDLSQFILLNCSVNNDMPMCISSLSKFISWCQETGHNPSTSRLVFPKQKSYQCTCHNTLSSKSFKNWISFCALIFEFLEVSLTSVLAWVSVCPDWRPGSPLEWSVTLEFEVPPNNRGCLWGWSSFLSSLRSLVCTDSLLRWFCRRSKHKPSPCAYNLKVEI